jgi:hypothetical protein
MSVLTSELREAHESFYSETVHVLEELGVENLYDYLNYLRNSDYSLPEKKFLEGTSLRAATRIYPGGDQNIIFASLNPKVIEMPEKNQNSGAVPSSTLKWLSPYTKDIEKYAAECAQEYQYNYLDPSVKGTRKNGYHELFDLLNDLGIISYPNGGRTEYLQDNSLSEVFSDIYFTNWFKLGTKDEQEAERLPDEIRRLSYNCLLHELEAVGGKLIFAFGDKIQTRLASHVIHPLTEEAPEYESVTSTERHGYGYETDIADGASVITVGHQSQGWGQSRGKGNDHLPLIRDTLEAIDI